MFKIFGRKPKYNIHDELHKYRVDIENFNKLRQQAMQRQILGDKSAATEVANYSHQIEICQKIYEELGGKG